VCAVDSGAVAGTDPPQGRVLPQTPFSRHSARMPRARRIVCAVPHEYALFGEASVSPAPLGECLHLGEAV
jgi:hypothetical protein